MCVLFSDMNLLDSLGTPLQHPPFRSPEGPNLGGAAARGPQPRGHRPQDRRLSTAVVREVARSCFGSQEACSRIVIWVFYLVWLPFEIPSIVYMSLCHHMFVYFVTQLTLRCGRGRTA